MSLRTVATSMLVAAVFAAPLVGGHPSPVAAADGRTDTAATTYELDPVHGQLKVTITLKVKNQTPDTTETYACTQYIYDYWLGSIPYTSTCSRTASYYLTSTAVLVENEATGIKASSGSSKLATTAGSKGTAYRVITVTFPKLWYGQTRTVTVSYMLKGAAPRTSSPVRLMQAYAAFCVTAGGFDAGSITVKVPAAFSFTTSGTDLPSRITGTQRVYSGQVADPGTYWTCFEGTNDAGLRNETVVGPGGRPVEIASWPEDPSWAAAVRSEVANGLPALSKLVGSPVPGTAPLLVKESVTGTEYAGYFDETSNTIAVGEDFNQPALVEHELAHVWFNHSLFDGVWLSEGSAEWAGRATSGDEPACTRPSSGASGVNLDAWKYLTPKSTDAERLAVATEYDAACYVVTQVFQAASVSGMVDALNALETGRDPYALDPGARRASKLVGWRDWLDAVDELALAPAGASPTLASALLLEFGVTTDRSVLDQRTAARAAYVALKAKVGDWVVPTAIRQPLTTWDFPAAQAAVAVAGVAWDVTGQTDAALPGLDARHGPAAKAWAAAATTADLVVAGTLAQAQLAAAKDVRDTQALAATPLDFVQKVGLLGSSIPPVDPAIPAVRDGRLDAAAATTASVRAAIGALRDVGQLRVNIAVSITLALLLLIAVTLVLRARSRRRRRNESVAATVSSAALGSDPSILPLLLAAADAARETENSEHAVAIEGDHAADTDADGVTPGVG
jgi:hypothetical protein